jgi:hypothetical protein
VNLQNAYLQSFFTSRHKMSVCVCGHIKENHGPSGHCCALLYPPNYEEFSDVSSGGAFCQCEQFNEKESQY